MDLHADDHLPIAGGALEKLVGGGSCVHGVTGPLVARPLLASRSPLSDRSSSAGQRSAISGRPITSISPNSASTSGEDANTKPSNDVLWFSKSLEISTR